MRPARVVDAMNGAFAGSLAAAMGVGPAPEVKPVRVPWWRMAWLVLVEVVWSVGSVLLAVVGVLLVAVAALVLVVAAAYAARFGWELAARYPGRD